MKSLGAEKVSADAGKEADENLEEAKEHLGNALKSGAAATATLGAGLVAKISEALEDAADNMKSEPIDLSEVRPAAAELARADIGRERTANAVSWSKVKVEPLFEDMVDFDTFSKSDFRAVKVKECVAVPKSKKLLQFTLDDGSGNDRTILSGIHVFYEPEELMEKPMSSFFRENHETVFNAN